MKKYSFFYLLFTCLCSTLHAQKTEALTEGANSSLRGLSVVTDKVVWVSGSNGTVGRSTDGGATWQWLTVNNFEKRDFRDIEAFDAATAVIMAVGEPACILKTSNGGLTWKLVYTNKTPGMFLDAMEFWNIQSGIVIGDPVNGKFFIARTFDGGSSWTEIPFQNLPAADSGEACFAASGTNIRSLDLDEACFVTGGAKARLFTKGTPVLLPVVQGRQSAGANSVAVRDSKQRKGSRYMVVTGGDFAADTASAGNCFVSMDGGKHWIRPDGPPHGYRSCVEFISKKTLVTCGTTGVDVSTDGGMNWRLVATESYHVCRKAKEGKAVFLAGIHGKIARLVMP